MIFVIGVLPAVGRTVAAAAVVPYRSSGGLYWSSAVKQVL